MEISAVIKQLKEKGRVKVKEGHEANIELMLPAHWDEQKDSPEAVFLFYDLFQIRTIAEQFSEVSLDIVEYATKPTIYHTSINRIYKEGPIINGIVKFSVINQKFWNSLLYSFGQPLVYQKTVSANVDFETKEYFPLLSEGVKEIYLSPEGDVKILRA